MCTAILPISKSLAMFWTLQCGSSSMYARRFINGSSFYTGHCYIGAGIEWTISLSFRGTDKLHNTSALKCHLLSYMIITNQSLGIKLM